MIVLTLFRGDMLYYNITLRYSALHSLIEVVILEAQPEGLSRKTKGNRLLRPCTVLPRVQRHCLAPPPKVQLR